MNATYIITTYVVIDDLLREMGFTDHHHAKVSTAEILTIAVVAAKYFQNHHERALCVLQLTHYIPKFSISRFNRRLHQVWQLIQVMLDFLGQNRIVSTGYVIDTMPLPVCRLAYADGCRKIPQKRGFIGRVAAKRTWFCGWRLHWICDATGFPIAFDIVPAVWHELTTAQYLMGDLPPGSVVFGDGAYISRKHHQLLVQSSGIYLISTTYPAMRVQNTPREKQLLRRFRNVIETAHSLLEKMGVQRLHAVTPIGFGIKVHASLFALIINHLID